MTFPTFFSLAFFRLVAAFRPEWSSPVLDCIVVLV